MSISPFFIFRFMHKCERCPRGIIVILAIRIACGTSCALVKRRFPVSRPIRVNLASRVFTRISLSGARREREKERGKKLHLVGKRYARRLFSFQATQDCITSLFFIEITAIFFFLFATCWSRLIFLHPLCVVDKLTSYQFLMSHVFNNRDWLGISEDYPFGDSV